MDVVLVLLAVVLIAYIVANLIIFVAVGSEPSTLTACVFGVATGELGIMGWIKNTKDRKRDREWEQEDKQDLKEDPKHEQQ